jgi:ferrochelatase
MVEEALAGKPVHFSDLAKPEKKVRIYPQDKSAWGMTPVAEVWNGRLAMLGFLALIAEIVTGQGPLHLIGLL